MVISDITYHQKRNVKEHWNEHLTLFDFCDDLEGLEIYTLSKISARRASQRKQMLTQFGGHLYWWAPSNSSYHLSESEAFMKSDKCKQKKKRIDYSFWFFLPLAGGKSNHLCVRAHMT